ncbi:MAG: phosphatase PAP2 family protein [Actinophytocola sp.]|uniref:phosphatase PAP2 family protein n=1 Tax=Actinophytocola sp. TaxID=1872138 RepID=UPI003C72577D
MAHGQTPSFGPGGRFAVRSAGALVAVVVVGAAFGLVATLVRVEWEPVRRLDLALADGLNDLLADDAVLGEVLRGVTDLGGTATLLWLMVVGALWLLLRRQPRLAAYVAVSTFGAMILNAVVKEFVGRLRPVVDQPVYTVPGLSFPSGHAMSSLVTYGVLLLVVLPLMHGTTRRVLTVVVVLIVVAIGFTRVALGAHFLTDVLAGWLLGTLWLLLTTLAFHRWRREAHVPATGPLPGDVPSDVAANLRPVPRRHPPTLSHPWQGIGVLAIAWVFLSGMLVGLGKLVAGDGGLPPLSWDHTIVAWLANHRDPAVTTPLRMVGTLGDTAAIVAGSLAIGSLAVALSRTWRPLLFVVVALIGEITLFLTTTAVVGRQRPEVDQLNPNLPPTSSFPSGHVAATLVLCTATALLAVTLLRHRWRWVVAGIAMAIPLLVAIERLYEGVHYPTDIAGSLLLAVPWTVITWRVLTPNGGMSDVDHAPASGVTGYPVSSNGPHGDTGTTSSRC